MKILAIAYWFTILSFPCGNRTLTKHYKPAREKKELVLLNFSGSDWCGPCMRMRKEIFDDATFTAMADTFDNNGECRFSPQQKKSIGQKAKSSK
jgi:thiol-disulfide isomerase/thioredoxin